MVFHSPSKGEMELEEVVKDIILYINEDISFCYKLLIGSDSHSKEEGTCFVSAIIIHRLGKGARYYYCQSTEQRIKSLRQRIFYEASLSLNLADQLSNYLKKYGHEEMKVEIHLDIGTQGQTREMIKELTGMIIKSGFDAKIKPDACAASKVADKYTK
ncbi:MAG: ribonuclease H-like YkuK family protein [Syntrophomonadaceae bacterium]|jgi:predicted RNase H-related nuclease YkuK (DUF458 family)